MSQHSLFFDTPHARSSPVKTVDMDALKSSNSRKRTYLASPAAPNALSPQKRQFLQNMSPNVVHRAVYVPSGGPKSTSSTSDKLKELQRPVLRAPVLNLRSKSLLSAFTRPKLALSPNKLRRTNSLISLLLAAEGQTAAISDRFIPTHKNATTGRLHTNTANPHPNASPQTHIRAQTSKIYQHHVAEACGLEVNLRILSYKPLPPDRNRPINLFGQIGAGNRPQGSKNAVSKTLLRPAAAVARAKKIPTAPERVLDAPGLVDDFYLNLLAWSNTNLLAIGLDDAVYVWNASTGSVGLLCELSGTLVTSLRWSEDGSYVSIGRDDGLVEIWDIETNSKLRTLDCGLHGTRIAAQAWSQHVLTLGSKTGHLFHSDVRVADHIMSVLELVHLAEICGLEYRADGVQLAAGGNDNLVSIWDVRNAHGDSSSQPLYVKTSHRAAVKALAWCPYQLLLLASGGGTSDKTINFWNTQTGARVNTIETGSQISSLNWGYATGTGMEIVASHGYPTNNLLLFNYPTLQKTGEITGAHDLRILNGCLSPDGLTLATVAGDENLKFWSLFDLYKQKKEPEGGSAAGDGGWAEEGAKRMKMNIR